MEALRAAEGPAEGRAQVRLRAAPAPGAGTGGARRAAGVVPPAPAVLGGGEGGVALLYQFELIEFGNLHHFCDDVELIIVESGVGV